MADNPLDELRVLLQNVLWGRPLDDATAAGIYEAVIDVQKNLGNLPEQLALNSVCDSILAWLIQPQDQDRIDRCQRTLQVYWRMCYELDAAAGLPQQIGSIVPDGNAFRCPSCDRSGQVTQIDDDTWQVVLVHAEGCLWAARPRGANPMDN
jgi:hypothetical protein